VTFRGRAKGEGRRWTTEEIVEKQNEEPRHRNPEKAQKKEVVPEWLKDALYEDSGNCITCDAPMGRNRRAVEDRARERQTNPSLPKFTGFTVGHLWPESRSRRWEEVQSEIVASTS
jgi:hypothetical protein